MTALDDITARFRKQSPNIAAAFDEVQRRLTLLEQPVVVPHPPPPPPSVFGADLFKGFEWAQVEPSGTIANVTTNQDLAMALASGADIIDGGGRTFTPGQMTLPAHASFRTVRNMRLTGSRVYKAGTSKWRLRGCDLFGGLPEDNLKAEAGGYLDIDGCDIHGAPRQGILLYHDDVVIRNSRVHHNGTLSNQDHGVYASGGNRLLVFNSAFYANQAYQMQVYPKWHTALIVCCTLFGGVTRGGVVVGSENVDATSDIRFVGCISSGAPGYGWDQWQTAYRIRIEDCLGWANSKGDVTASLQASTVRFEHGDPKFKDAANGDFSPIAGSAAKGIIDPSLHPLVPPTDIDGRPRVTADAGAHAT